MAYAAQPYHGGKNHPEQVTGEFLTCALCSVPGFRQPKILLCGHVFCLNCLEAWWGTGIHITFHLYNVCMIPLLLVSVSNGLYMSTLY